MGFRENLKSELQYSGIMVKELAVATGISRHTIDNYLNVRNCEPSADAAVKIARVLGVTVEYLVTGLEIRRISHEMLSVPIDVQIINRNLLKLGEKDRKVVSAVIQSLIERNREDFGRSGGAGVWHQRK
jgi:transcriptional regulator with XRE-family HTH domain